jgi:hypothetical protein
MAPRWSLFRLGCVSAAAAVLAGCSAPSRADPDSPTRGLSLEMEMRGEGNLAVLYRVETDGTIGFGGGADAVQREITWTGPLAAEEIERLWVLLEEHGWLSGDLRTTGEQKRPEYRIRLRWPSGSRRFKVRGANPGVTPVEELLEQAARRRLQGFLGTFPRPAGRSGDRPSGPGSGPDR